MAIDAELVADLIDRLQHGVLITPASTSSSSGLSGYCVDLVVRLWSLAVIDHRRGLGLLGGGGDGSHLFELHRRIGDVMIAAGETDGRLDDRVDGSLYELAVAVGMPRGAGGPGPMETTRSHDSKDSKESEYSEYSERSKETTLAGVMAMGHIASVVQCGVMALGALGGHGGDAGDAHEDTRQGSNKTEVVDGLRRLRRVARRLQSPSAVRGEVVTLEALCGEVFDAVEGAKGTGSGAVSALPAGFFDVMIPYGMDSLDEGQREMLARVASALQEETALRRKMMVDRALATLKTFTIRQEAANVRVLDTLTEAARARMGVILEGRVAGVEEAWRMIKGEVVSLLVERGVGEEHGSVSNRIKTVQIGRVPDRGGRPEGVSRQAALMPEWKAREEAKKAAHGKGQNRGSKKQRK